ncbi:hypothetical protein EFP68_01240 [Lactobacillus helveticus]|uniref:hypothetical protein n=1 Tax=Lactobacillus helveticus TaxID=1587 RepID=UPI001C1DE960|nr:hypothetical protein [Lactobacillus helveticus]MBU5980026.1 hypothetical protein [Lactobacillus helveticus]MCT3413369.1 hypothetical protein [Lactobacillus helveticus]
MTVKDWIELGFLASWVVCLATVGIFSRLHFKNKKVENYRVTAVHAMQKWVAFYDKEDLNNPEKANGALNDVVKELNSKGYKITDQQVRNLEALREWVLVQLRMKQAQTGVAPSGITTQEVPDDQILKPVDQLKNEPESEQGKDVNTDAK